MFNFDRLMAAYMMPGPNSGGGNSSNSDSDSNGGSGGGTGGDTGTGGDGGRGGESDGPGAGGSNRGEGGDGGRGDGGRGGSSNTGAGEARGERSERTGSTTGPGEGSLTAGALAGDDKGDTKDEGKYNTRTEGPQEPAKQKQERLSSEATRISGIDPSERTPTEASRLESYKSGYDVAQAVDTIGNVAGIAGPVGGIIGGVADLANRAYNSFADDEYRSAGAAQYGENTGGLGQSIAAKGIQMATGIPSAFTNTVASAVTGANYGGQFGPAEKPQQEPQQSRFGGDGGSMTSQLMAPQQQPVGTGFDMATFNPAYELKLMRG